MVEEDQWSEQTVGLEILVGVKEAPQGQVKIGSVRYMRAKLLL